MTSFEDLIVVGRFSKPQGRHGEILTRLLSDHPDRLASLDHVLVEAEDGGARRWRVERSWPHKGQWVLKLEGVDSISAAEALRGRRLGLPAEELDPLEEGAYYFHQLRGLTCVDDKGVVLGEVEEILETGATPVLVVRDRESERLIPFAESFVDAVDVEAGKLRVRLLETVDAAD